MVSLSQGELFCLWLWDFSQTSDIKSFSQTGLVRLYFPAEKNPLNSIIRTAVIPELIKYGALEPTEYDGGVHQRYTVSIKKLEQFIVENIWGDENLRTISRICSGWKPSV